MSASKLCSVGSVGPLTPNVAAEVHASLLIFTGTSNINYLNGHVHFTLLADAIFLRLRFARHQRVCFNLVARYLRKAESLRTIL